jgi:hypothetical protein
MSTLAVWHAELARGERTLATWDVLFFAAQREAADDEFENTVGQPQRFYLKSLKERGRRKRDDRPAKWERDLAMSVEYDDGA